MATITFKDGKKIKVRPMRAMRLQFIQRGHLSATPEIMKYLKRVKSIEFDTAEPPKPNRQIPNIRLPYVD